MSAKVRNKRLYTQARLSTGCSQDDWGRLFNLGIKKGQDIVSKKENDAKGVNLPEALSSELLRFLHDQGYDVKNIEFNEQGEITNIKKFKK